MFSVMRTFAMYTHHENVWPTTLGQLTFEPNPKLLYSGWWGDAADAGDHAKCVKTEKSSIEPLIALFSIM